ncbi:RNA pseudouridine synthase [Enterovibrio norvegicus]|uniref:tRNA pseudouridine32 synthase / 23S rRNA pseudouridine746 synthase n=2 Tax=Enterovibrio norvegicus TaxID=188144 RepID=A0A1I5JV41_9GAMM|nr:RluA family pseudouridine synthase [Enterovibrio norvegicus]MCC4797346.1 RluA family pseudouridine synthase [Enterovibrio norvegicus]OEF58402.1 RNA pseudouridine synthase [Enterovibrio norvegicus]OEF64479.1 RNA pseudouridine synthase [Enterovibrio norvegicus]PMI27067.1 RNA pseudouridine synthase [Enterovibrio norvegicus]PMI40185.1 RNA pseudouridine synthase [Enterovibrio norvegicus]
MNMLYDDDVFILQSSSPCFGVLGHILRRTMSATDSQNHTIVDDFVAPACEGFISLLYQDDDILLIDKPSGLFSLSGKNPLNWDSVHYRLVHGQEGRTRAFPDAKLPHRLDFGTSGIMVVALHAESAKHLNKQFQDRAVQKQYMAMLEGWVSEDHGQITAAIAKDKTLFPRVKLCADTGKRSVSDYAVITRYPNPQRTLVKYTPVTGRTHQLRIHSLSMGHPILGCDLYSSDTSERLASRLQLHASDLFFVHPMTGEKVHGQSECPF